MMPFYDHNKVCTILNQKNIVKHCDEDSNLWCMALESIILRTYFNEVTYT